MSPYNYKLHLIKRHPTDEGDWLNIKILDTGDGGGPFESVTQVLSHAGVALTQAMIDNRIPDRDRGIDLCIYDAQDLCRLYTLTRKEV